MADSGKDGRGTLRDRLTHPRPIPTGVTIGTPLRGCAGHAPAARRRRLPGGSPIGYNRAPRGDVAQLGERRVRNAKVEGSIPFVSTTNTLGPERSGPLLFWAAAPAFVACRSARLSGIEAPNAEG